MSLNETLVDTLYDDIRTLKKQIAQLEFEEINRLQRFCKFLYKWKPDGTEGSYEQALEEFLYAR